ncbi:hypothetical protein IWZ01DRAFT_345872 [Phyllosticta capitalensis]
MGCALHGRWTVGLQSSAWVWTSSGWESSATAPAARGTTLIGWALCTPAPAHGDPLQRHGSCPPIAWLHDEATVILLQSRSLSQARRLLPAMIAPFAAWATGDRDALFRPLSACKMLSRAACILPIAVLRDDHGNTVAGVYSHAILSILRLPLRRLLAKVAQRPWALKKGISSPVRIEMDSAKTSSCCPCSSCHLVVCASRTANVACVFQLSNRLDTGRVVSKSLQQARGCCLSWQLAGSGHFPSRLIPTAAG